MEKPKIDLVGHHVVHGGTKFDKAVVVDPHVESVIQRLAVFAPLHIALGNGLVRVLIVKSREDWQIARECQELGNRTLSERDGTVEIT